MMIRPPSLPSQTVQLHRMRKQFRQIDEAAYFIDNAIIDYCYIDIDNTDITF